jgi:signal transduction histidine kinase
MGDEEKITEQLLDEMVRLLGVLNLVADAPRTFSPADVALLERFAPLAAAALENNRLLAAEREQRELAETLCAVASVLNTSLDRERVLTLILEQLARVVEYDSASVALVSDGMLTLVANQGFQSEGPLLPPLPIGDLPHVQEVLEGQRPGIIPDIDAAPHWPRHPATQNVRCWLGVPLVVQNRVIGLLNLGHGQPGFYTERDAHIAQTFAYHAAIAIENARLFTEIQTAYKELKQAQAQLIQSAQMAAVSGLAAGVAHELNNPLTAVLGFAELSLRRVAPDDPMGEDLAVVVAEARRARDIVQDLLAFSRQTESFYEKADVNQVMRDTLALVHRQIEKNHVTLVEQYATDLPPLSLAVGRMKQVFLNLITNALHAMPHGGTLVISSEQVGGEVAVRVADTGVGIPADHLPRLFEPFFSTKPAEKGTGLGLSVSLGIVQEHGGRIIVESQVEKGSTFTVWLPVAEGNRGDGAWPGNAS